MAFYNTPGHRSNQSLSLQPPPPAGRQQRDNNQRRMTSPAMSSTSSLALPDGARQSSASRPPSPLRNAFTFDSSTGIDPNDESYASDDSSDEDHPRQWRRRSPSPSSSVSNLAASFVQRMNNFVGGISVASRPHSPHVPPRSPSLLPSDAELEAEAERERERSRREAEKILTREAKERKVVEDRVLAMVGSTRSLPPPPSRSQTMPSPSGMTSSPSSSQKDKEGGGGWWQATKNKLTGKEKESPTPAQQVILDAKARDKDGVGKKEKGKGRDEDEFGGGTGVGSLNLAPLQPPLRKPAPPSPSSPTPSRPNISTPNLSPSPMPRSVDSNLNSNSPLNSNTLNNNNLTSTTNSPSGKEKEAPPLYAQFTPQGTLDVAGTLLAIARRFEKLEKWTVGHVRALEERMDDVERWLVDKEKEKEGSASAAANNNTSNATGGDIKASDAVKGGGAFKDEMNEIRDEISELQGRVGELGREMARMVAAPTNLVAGPKARSVKGAVVSVGQSQIQRQASSLTSFGVEFGVEEGGGGLPPTPFGLQTEPQPQPQPQPQAQTQQQPILERQPYSSSPSIPPILPPILPILPDLTGTSLSGTPRHSRLSSTALDTTSPPLASRDRRTPSGTKLPYPTGDYNSPPDSVGGGGSGVLGGGVLGAFSPTGSPNSSIGSGFRRRGLSSSAGAGGGSPAGVGGGSKELGASISRRTERTESPTPISSSVGQGAAHHSQQGSMHTQQVSNQHHGGANQGQQGLPPPKAPKQRQGSVSPTPRKRYTVALGGPIVAPPDYDELQSNHGSGSGYGEERDRDPVRRVGTPRGVLRRLGSEEGLHRGTEGPEKLDEDEGEDGGETIGKSASRKLTRSLATKRSSGSLNSGDEKPVKADHPVKVQAKVEDGSKVQEKEKGREWVPSARRVKAQSVYGFSMPSSATINTTSGSAINTANNTVGLGPTAPLRLKTRTRSSETLSSTRSGFSNSSNPLVSPTGFEITTATGGRFVDPLLLRRQQEEGGRGGSGVGGGKGGKGVGKVPVGQLVAFFDKDKK